MSQSDITRRTSEALRALSHEHRLMILSALNGTERSVSELEKLLAIAQPAVSHQLARLRLDDLVEARRDGRAIYYKACSERIQAILSDLALILGYRVERCENWAPPFPMQALDAEAGDVPDDTLIDSAEASQIDDGIAPRLSAVG